MNNADWGFNSISDNQNKKREVPYFDFNNNKNIKRFAPLSNQTYTLTIPVGNGWTTACEMWSHTVTKNGLFSGRWFSRSLTFDGFCPFAHLNAQAGRGKGKDSPYPMTKQFVFPVIVDEVPEHSFLLYIVSQRTYEQVRDMVKEAGGPNFKIKLKGSGSGRETTYNFFPAGQPINQNAVNSALKNIPVISDNQNDDNWFKKVLIGLENPFDPSLGYNLPTEPGTVSTASSWDIKPDQNSNPTPESNPFNDNKPFDNTKFETGNVATTTNNNSVSVDNSLSYSLDFGPTAGKQFKDIDDSTLKSISNVVTGEAQEHALAVLKSRGIQ